MTPEQLLKDLKKMGIDPSKWVQIEDKFVKPVAIEKQQQLLIQMRGLLEDVMEQDKKKVLALKEQVARLKHGGGI